MLLLPITQPRANTGLMGKGEVEPPGGVRDATSYDVATACFPALGTSATVAVTDSSRLGPALEVVKRVVGEFDQACSRFRPDSDLSALNAGAGRWVRVDALLIEAVSAALRAARQTDGAVDPTVGGALIALGYDRDFGELTATGPRRDALPRVSIAPIPGWRAVTIDLEASAVRVPPGVKLDLGSTAKALAADRAAALAAATADCGVLVSLGGDIATAGRGPAEGWPVRVTDDHRAGVAASGQWIALKGGGLATSSTTTRCWQTRSGPAHHVIDPGTGRSATGPWRTASIAAASCLDANTASTAAIVRGGGAVSWLESRRLPSRLVGVDGSARHLAGWPTAGDELA
jgi:thiamine biosynthesis lipoprotein